MIRFSFVFIFIISIASAAFGFLLSSDLRKRNPDSPVYTSILIQQILIFVFAFYGIWGHIFSTSIFSTELINPALIEKISVINTLFAIPFLCVSWWFQLYVFFSFSSIPKSRLRTTLSLLISLVLLIGFYIFLSNGVSLFEAFKQLFFIENMVLSVLISAIVLTIHESVCKKAKRIIVSLIVFFSGALISLGTIFYTLNQWVTIIFILFFFIYQTWLPLVFRFVFETKTIYKEGETKFEKFCKIYSISKRESEIITEICMGLSNKEIAERLFISIQTVKDHSSRIYYKTEVKNRIQLAKLVQDSLKNKLIREE